MASSWGNSWLAAWGAAWGTITSAVQSVVGGGATPRIDGALDKRAMDEVVLRKRRKRAAQLAAWAYGSGAIR
jgi:hypothetical protein